MPDPESDGTKSEWHWVPGVGDLIARGLRSPEFLIVNRAAGLEKALAALWPDVPTQRWKVQKHRNLLAQRMASARGTN